MRKKIFWTIVGVLALLARVPVAEAWDSVGTYTHEKIADDAIASLAMGDYPDLHRFAEQLRDGSETENSHDLMNDGQSDLWGGDSETWWDGVETGGSRKGVLPWYKEHNFNNAYEMLGYMLHLEQDIDVPAHITYCAHGRTGVFTFHIDGLESYADGAAHFGYTNGTTDWQFTDQKGYEWRYWLTDSEDDDDEDHDAGGFSLEDDAGDANDEGSPLIVDGPNAYEVPNTSWGTYGYGDYLFGFDRVPGLNEGIWRDYCLQYLAGCYEASPAEAAPDSERDKITTAYWDATAQSGKTFSGTALIGLEALSEKYPEIDRKKVELVAVALADDQSTCEASRITALRLCGKMKQVEALKPARSVAQTGKTIPLRMAAIATLGDLGELQDLEYLQGVAVQDAPRLKPVLEAAIKAIRARLASNKN